jgi:hypothetical protein
MVVLLLRFQTKTSCFCPNCGLVTDVSNKDLLLLSQWWFCYWGFKQRPVAFVPMVVLLLRFQTKTSCFCPNGGLVTEVSNKYQLLLSQSMVVLLLRFQTKTSCFCPNGGLVTEVSNKDQLLLSQWWSCYWGFKQRPVAFVPMVVLLLRFQTKTSCFCPNVGLVTEVSLYSGTSLSGPLLQVQSDSVFMLFSGRI